METPLPAHQKAIKIAIVHIISGWHARTMRTADHGSAIRYPPFRTWPGKRILRHNTLASSRGCCRPCWLAASQAVCRPRSHPVRARSISFGHPVESLSRSQRPGPF